MIAAASAFWPLLVAVVIVGLRAPRAQLLLASFLTAGLMTTIIVGLGVVYSLRLNGTASSPRSIFGPVVQIVGGSFAVLMAAFITYRRVRFGPDPADRPERPGWVERMLGRGPRIAFVLGVVLHIVPGFLPLVALRDIAAMDHRFLGTLLLIVLFYAVMFSLVELPLIGFTLAPSYTAEMSDRFISWMGRRSYLLSIGALLLVGTYLIVRGVTRLVA